MRTLAPGDRFEHMASGKKGRVMSTTTNAVRVLYDDGEVNVLLWAKNVPQNARLLQRLIKTPTRA